MNAVIGVVGGSGGVGASTFAAGLARTASAAMIVDLDVAGGGIDVLLGIEAVSGARWSDVSVDGGQLDPDALSQGVPQWAGCGVLAADVRELSSELVMPILEAARHRGAVVLDLPRIYCAEGAAGLLHCDLVVVLVRADVVGVAAAHAVVSMLPEVPAGVVVRRGVIDPSEAAGLVGLPLLGRLPQSVAPVGGGRVPRSVLSVADAVVAGVGARRAA